MSHDVGHSDNLAEFYQFALSPLIPIITRKQMHEMVESSFIDEDYFVLSGNAQCKQLAISHFATDMISQHDFYIGYLQNS